MMQLRDYQLRALDEIWSALQVKHNILITAPCSAGKTIIFSKIIQRLIRENPAFRTLILVDREILVQQSADKLKSVAPELANHIGIVCASVSSIKRLDARVTVASRQSLIKSMGEFAPVQLIICDEAHLMSIPHIGDEKKDQYGEIISILKKYNEHVRLVGCTASPYRLGKRGGYIYGDMNSPDATPYFDRVDSEITTRELLAGGFISPLVGMAAIDDTYVEDIANIAMVAGEYNMGQLSNMMCKGVHLQSAVDAWTRYAKDRKKTLVFCTNIEHAELMAQTFRDYGISSCAIHSKLPQVDQAARMAELVAGTRKVFASVAKLTTGFDVPDIDCCIMARPTKSTALYQQMIGRGQRLAPGKENCMVIDLTGCTKEFGTDMDNLTVAIPRGGEGGEAPKKICPGNNADGSVCGQSIHASLRYCPYCQHEFPAPPEMEAALGAMKEVAFNKAPEPEIYNVTYVNYQVHLSKKSGKELIKVSYESGSYATFNEWVCLPDHYDGYAVNKAKDWWAERTDEPFPGTVEEFMFLRDELIEPIQVEAIEEGRFKRVTRCIFKSEEDLYDEVVEDPFDTIGDYGTGELPF